RAAERRQLADQLEHREMLVDGDDGAPTPPGAVRPIVDRPGLARQAGGVKPGEESLEVAEAVATIAPGVDPVVAEPTGVAPGPDGVRMDAENLGCASHRQG